MEKDQEHEHEHEHSGACCSGGVGGRWTVAESFEENFHRILAAAALSNEEKDQEHEHEHEHEHERSGSCCSGGVGGRWMVAESFEEIDFHRSLAAAALSNDMPRMHHLLSRGAAPDTSDSSGYTPLHYAARSGHPDACLLLLQNGAEVDKCTRAGKATSLHRAAYTGHIEVVKLLLKAGADPLKEDSDGLTPLQKAEAQGHAEIVKLLASATLKPSKK